MSGAKSPAASSVLSSQVTYQLAAELAAGLYSTPDILEKFGLSANQLTKIVTDAHFKEIYREAKAIWHGSANVKERIRTKAALLLEDSILPVYAIVHNADVAPAARIDAFSKLVAIADMQPTRQDGSGGGGDRFVLNIAVGDDKKQVTIEEVDTNAVSDISAALTVEEKSA